MIIIPFP